MDNVIGVRFAKTGRLYYMNPLNYEVKVGDKIVAKSERGQEIGRVVSIKTVDEFKKLDYKEYYLEKARTNSSYTLYINFNFFYMYNN